MTTPLGASSNLGKRLAKSIRDRILRGEWAAGTRLPSELDIGDEYEVSRTTVRAALRTLEAEGFTRTRHGAGTFVSQLAGAVTAPLTSLRSFTETIEEQGHTPSMRYESVEVRAATAAESEALDLDDGAMVLGLRSLVESDGLLVAYSIDTIPMALLPPDFEISEVAGSTFKLLAERSSLVATQSIAKIGARMTIPGIDTDVGVEPPFLVLEQRHFTDTGLPLMLSTTYFVEDRFQFTVIRTATD